MRLFLALGFLAIACSIGGIAWRRAEKRRAGRFVGRSEPPIAAEWALFRESSGLNLDSTEEALSLVQAATEVPKVKLRPEDRFAVELAPEKGWEFDDGLVELRWVLEARGVNAELEVLTVGDFVKAYAGGRAL